MFARTMFAAAVLTLSALTGTAAPLSFQITFGERQERPKDYSGSIAVSSGEVVGITPWRFTEGDAVEGAGWRLELEQQAFEIQPDKARHMMADPQTLGVMPAGIVVTVDAPETARLRVTTKQGDFDLPVSNLRHGHVLRFLDDDVLLQRATSAERANAENRDEHFDYPSVASTQDGGLWMAWQGYSDGGDQVYARRRGANGWGETFRLTDEKTDVLRTAIGEDSRGRVWVAWSEREGRQWNLYARGYANGRWGGRRQLTSGNFPNVYHRLVRAADGALHCVWVGHEGGQSYVYWFRFDGGAGRPEPRKVSGPSAWVPEAASDSKGNLWVSWDSYRNGNYDIYLRRVGPDGALGDEMQVTKSDLFQTHPTVALDLQDRVWLAWHESGAQWGKDWTHEDSFRSTVLYAYRRPRVAVYDGSKWRTPAVDPIQAFPARYHRYVQNPRIAVDGQGRVWLGAQVRSKSNHQRNDFWAFDGRWEFFLTSLEGDRWAQATPIPMSSARPEATLQLEARPQGVRLAWANDNRPANAPGFYQLIPNHYEVFTSEFGAGTAPKAPLLIDRVEAGANAIVVHPDERAELARIRGYRTELNGRSLRILRGDFHRHTEISTDGSGDGSLEDYFRYMIDAGAMETGIVGDHNIGNNDEYAWWRTEKAIDVFLIEDRYTPMFGYERSCGYPNGHRNVVFAERGVPTLAIPPDEGSGKIPTGPILYPYLRQYNGICMSHSTATSQGTDFRDWDEELEPLVELYQGYHASYEYPGAPRAESEDVTVRVHGKYEPGGFWWDALAKGKRIGVGASSDHISTHSSYTVIYTPSMAREDILESMRARHAYAATDNIIVDFQAETSEGERRFMGDAFKATRAPKLKVKIIGTDPIAEIDLIKDGQFVYHFEPGTEEAEFEFVDNEIGSGESYYYVRVQQRDRNLAWSSPIWVDYSK